MAQKISVKIAEREYVMSAQTPEQEELIRLAADEINKRITGYLANYPGRQLTDILSFVALTVCYGNISLKRELEAIHKESENLEKDTRSYLDSIKK